MDDLENKLKQEKCTKIVKIEKKNEILLIYIYMQKYTKIFNVKNCY